MTTEKRERVLEKLRFALKQRIAEEAVDATVDVDAFVGFAADEIAIAVRGFVLGEQVPGERNEVVYPATWWDAVRDRWQPAWSRKRWPVNYVHRCFCAMAVYPGYHPLPGKCHYRIVERPE